MVIFNCFEVDLVHADTKQPFKMHEKDGRYYVEAEPQAEYFLRVKKNLATRHHRCLKYHVDGVDLKYLSKFHKDAITSEGDGLRGMYHRGEDGTVSMTALKFVRPKVKKKKKRNAKNGSASSDDDDDDMMGSIGIKVYKGVITDMPTPRYASSSSSSVLLKPKTVSISTDATTTTTAAALGEPKTVRTSIGAITTTGSSAGTNLWHRSEEPIAQLTIYYCSVMELVRAGIVCWTEMQTKSPGWELTVQPQRHCWKGKDGKTTIVELFDLSTLPDDFEPVSESEEATQEQGEHSLLSSPLPSTNPTRSSPRRTATAAVTPSPKRRRQEQEQQQHAKPPRKKRARKDAPSHVSCSSSNQSGSTSTMKNDEDEHKHTKCPLFGDGSSSRPRFRSGRVKLKNGHNLTRLRPR